MDFLSNEELFLKGVKFLTNLDKDNRYGWLGRNLKPTPGELYVQGIVTAGGTQSLLGGSTVQEKGVTNFDGNHLQKDRIFVVSAVTVQYGEAAVNTKPYNVSYKDEFPPQLENATLLIKQKNEVIVKLPISAIQNAKKSDDFYRKLGALALIEPEHEVEMYLEFPSGTAITPATAGHKSFVRVLLQGLETYAKRF